MWIQEYNTAILSLLSNLKSISDYQGQLRFLFIFSCLELLYLLNGDSIVLPGAPQSEISLVTYLSP